jgi:rhamnogalacturonan endolyase
MKTTLRNLRVSFVAASLVLTVTGLPAAERLDRGTVALPRPDGSVYVGWRLLLSDPSEATFDVYRADSAQGRRSKLNPKPISNACDFVDGTAGGKQTFYFVEPGRADGKRESSQAVQAAQDAGGFLRLKLQGNYRAQKVGLADFDGDGRLDYLVKQPDFNTDPYQQPGYWKKSEDTYKLEAYRHDGTFL